MAESINVVSANLKHGALFTPNGHPDDRFDDALDLIALTDPDLLLLQEVSTWWNHNHQVLAAAEHDLGMRVPVGHPTGKSTLLMYNPQKLRLIQHETAYMRCCGGPSGYSGVSVFTLDDIHTLAATSVHLSPESTVTALGDLERLIWRTRRHSPNVIFGGDINHPHAPHPLDPAWPDPHTLPAANVVGRFTPQYTSTTTGDLEPTGQDVPNPTFAHTLRRGRFSDVAHLWADQHDQDTSLAVTGQGGFRVDSHHVSENLTGAITHHAQVDNPYSDHKIIHTRIAPDRIDLSQEVTPHR